ncbi:ubiquinone biosynthesis methyltransferase UbiE [Methanococcoides methylutens]|uniref:Ubiquinone biosynthesis methyltransferase UbiE n=1 Tax=Methanococcoides methylutens TaxID=2226 RepID=A0A099T6H6_METMT|nr:class I SAM-dependent methyltransferase [Methanococcoides methylutens]KGK99748.1 ubiquinone biosynthesis methyltransferase UbiE [Methanococcoides methylutens]
MQENDLSMKEIEDLGYYDFMSYLGVPYFHVGGLTSTERLAELCQVNKDSKVLMVGCGTGFSACFVAQRFGCSVVGVDIAEVSIRKAKERAKSLGLGERVEFRMGDAYDLPFEPDTFDVVITEFVAQFLDTNRAFREFVRVLKPGGMVGINEMYMDADIPPSIAEEILEAEHIFGEITQLPFSLPSPEEWKQWLEKAGLSDVQVHKNKISVSLKEFKLVTRTIGGFGEFARLFMSLMIGMARYTISSKTIRNRFRQLSKGKRILMRNRSTSKHVGYVLAVGRKV